MEIRTNVDLIILSIKSDEITKRMYIKVLTGVSVEYIKINSSFDKYKYNHLLKYDQVLNVEFVKTRKNWILKEIISSKHFIIMENFVDYEKLSQISSLLNKYLQENQEVDNLLFSLLEYFNEYKTDQIEIENFEKFLLYKLGFGLDKYSSLQQSKGNNHL